MVYEVLVPLFLTRHRDQGEGHEHANIACGVHPNSGKTRGLNPPSDSDIVYALIGGSERTVGHRTCKRLRSQDRTRHSINESYGWAQGSCPANADRCQNSPPHANDVELIPWM